MIASRAQAIDGIVGNQYAAGQVHVASDKRVQALPHHGLHQAGDQRNVDDRLQSPAASALRSGAMGDVDRQVAHPLQVGVDFQCRDDEAKIARHRLVERQQVDGKRVDLEFDRVDPGFVRENFFRGAAIFLELQRGCCAESQSSTSELISSSLCLRSSSASPNLFNGWNPHDWCNTVLGSAPAAIQAGPSAAARETANRNASTPVSTMGSCGDTP